MTDPKFGGDLRGEARRRFARIAVAAIGVAAFGVAGLSGALAQDDDAGDVLATGTVGGTADISVPAMDILGEDFWEEIFAGLFPTGGTDELVTVPTGGSGGDINVGGAMGGEITVGSGGSGGLSISGPSTDSGSLTIGGGTSGSNSGSGSDDGFYE
jgi:hypothetical protein